jgi:hypothetical protein
MGALKMMAADAVTIQSQPTMRLEYQQERKSRTHFLRQGVQGVQVIKVPPEWTWQVEPIKKILGTLLLPDNWDSYGGRAPGVGSAAAAIDFIALIAHEDLPRPRVVPLGTGGIQLEWRNGQRELEVEFSPDESIEVLKIEGGSEGEQCSSFNTADITSLFAWLLAA